MFHKIELLVSSLKNISFLLKFVSVLRSWDEPVADSVHGHKIAGRFGFGLQLLPQVDYVSIHGAGVGEGLIAPDGVQDH